MVFQNLNFTMNRPTDSVFKLECPSVVCLCVCVCHRGNLASRWTGDFWSKRITLMLEYLQMFLSFWRCDEFLHYGFFLVYVSLQISLLGIMVELAWVCGCSCWRWREKLRLKSLSFLFCLPFLSVSVCFGISTTIRTH